MTKYIKNIHGTDGIRGMITESETGHPLFDFINTGKLSPSFFSFYTYAFSLYLLMIEKVEPNNILIATDNRDPSGNFIKNACLGCAYAGFDVINAGILPTPAIPTLMKKFDSVAGIMLTASHNAASYHGIKLFLGNGLKMNRDQEQEFTRLLYYFSENALPDQFETVITEHHSEAVNYFVDFHKKYSKLNLPDHTKIHLYVDCANGAFSETAKNILDNGTFLSVTAINDDLDKEINTGGGAAEFEHLDIITRELFSQDKHLKRLNIIDQIFSAVSNKIRASSILNSEYYVGLVFDGDGDRCVCLVYNPLDDAIHVFTGDKMVALIIKNRIDKNQGTLKLFTTIESDVMLTDILPEDACSAEITPVGDKWLSYKMEECLDDPNCKDWQLIGYEDSGHIIFPIQTDDGNTLLCGNGMIGGIEFLKAFIALSERYFDEINIDKIMTPYNRGIKETVSIYNTQKHKLILSQPENAALKSRFTELGKKLKKKGYSSSMLLFPAEPDTVYFEISGFEERGILFVRNSGTENKTSVYMRGSLNMYDTLVEIRNEILLYLHLNIKDYTDPVNIEVFECLKLLYNSPKNTASARKINLPEPDLRILTEKEKLLRYKTGLSLTLTDNGLKIITSLLEQFNNDEFSDEPIGTSDDDITANADLTAGTTD